MAKRAVKEEEEEADAPAGITAVRMRRICQRIRNTWTALLLLLLLLLLSDITWGSHTNQKRKSIVKSSSHFRPGGKRKGKSKSI